MVDNRLRDSDIDASITEIRQLLELPEVEYDHAMTMLRRLLPPLLNMIEYWREYGYHPYEPDYEKRKQNLRRSMMDLYLNDPSPSTAQLIYHSERMIEAKERERHSAQPEQAKE